MWLIFWRFRKVGCNFGNYTRRKYFCTPTSIHIACYSTPFISGKYRYSVSSLAQGGFSRTQTALFFATCAFCVNFLVFITPAVIEMNVQCLILFFAQLHKPSATLISMMCARARLWLVTHAAARRKQSEVSLHCSGNTWTWPAAVIRPNSLLYPGSFRLLRCFPVGCWRSNCSLCVVCV